MLRRLALAALAAAIMAVFGFAATAVPASADQDDHHVKYHAPHPGHWNRQPNPYGANGYWSNGSWHNRANPGRHNGWTNHSKHPKHPKHDRDDRR